MKVFDRLWRILTPRGALADCGPVERKFLEKVYRLAYITGISYSDDGKWYKLYRVVTWIMSILIVGMEIWHACTDHLSLNDMISTVDVIVIHLVTAWKLIIMLINKDIYKNLAKSLDSPRFDTSTSQRKKLVDHWAQTHRRYLSILLRTASLTLFFWYTFPLVDDVEYNLMIEIHVPHDYKSALRYIVTYIVIGIMFNAISWLVVMSEVLMQAYLLPLICQYAVLADCFENVFEECAAGYKDIDKKELIYDKQFIDTYRKRLGDLVHHHLTILNQTAELKRILSAPMLGQLCGSGMLICMVGYQAKATMTENTGKFMMSVGYLAYNMFTLYLICRWCEEITSQSQRVGEAAYCSGWEAGTSTIPGVRAAIMIVVARANKPMVFIAGGMYKLSLSSYTNLVKASYSALNILLRMSND